MKINQICREGVQIQCICKITGNYKRNQKKAYGRYSPPLGRPLHSLSPLSLLFLINRIRVIFGYSGALFQN